jgi:anaerobic selenocysteine-containing dehydrogenase
VRAEALHPPSPSDGYPLFLTTGGNLPGYTHWQFRYLPKLRRMAPEPRLQLHPATALAHDLADGDAVEVHSPHGTVRLTAELTEGIRPDTVHLAQGWEDANANELTTGDGADPISGFPNLKSLRCRIRRDEHRPL